MWTKQGCAGTTRRELLWQMGAGFPALALADLLSGDGFLGRHAAYAATPADTKSIRKKAKSCIFLFMFGGPSQVDLITNRSFSVGMARVSTTNSVVERRQKQFFRPAAGHLQGMARVVCGALMHSLTFQSTWTSWRWCIRSTPIHLPTAVPCSK